LNSLHALAKKSESAFLMGLLPRAIGLLWSDLDPPPKTATEKQFAPVDVMRMKG
jgi:hypothetical protein